MRRQFTETEQALIRELYPNTKAEDIAKKLNRGISAIYGFAYKNGLKKSEEFLNSTQSGRLNKLTASGLNYRFKKGQIPHNKGKKMPDHVYEKFSKTMFKKGNLPHNTKFDGALSVRKDKTGIAYLHQRVASGKWELYHRLLWERHNGPIPENYNIAFKDGNSANVTIENLELVSRVDLMKRKSFQNYPDDIKKLIHVKAALTRRINQQIRENEQQ